MRIGLVIIHALRTHSSKYALEVTKHWVREGYEVEVFVNKYDKFPNGVKVHFIPAPFKKFYAREAFFTMSSTLVTNIYKALKNFDVTISQATRFFTPDIAYQQFVYKNWTNLLGVSGLTHKIVNWIEGRNLRKCKKIVAMSNRVKQEIIKWYGIENEKIKVIYSGVDTEKFSPKNRKKYFKKVREKHGIDKNEIVLLFVGNPYSRKGLNYLIDALPYIKHEFKLLILGRDLGNDRIENYFNQAKKLGVDNKLIYAGFTREVYKYFAVSDIFVFPTLYEPFGLVILEAMASGLAIVTSNPRYCGASELIENEKEGLLLRNPKSSKEIAEKVNLLLEEPHLIKKFGNRARKKAESFTWKRTAKEFLEVFEEVKRK
jgi:UDP-glucose:(heptosyl)LPS alpha-1,3-glucosyltransferase